MANQMYPLGRDAFVKKLLDWIGDNFTAYLIDLDLYTPNFVTDEFLSDIPAGARVSSVALANKLTDGDGGCSADDAVFPSVTGNESEAVVVVLETGDPATDRLVVFWDTSASFPFQPDGNNINLNWLGAVLFKI